MPVSTTSSRIFPTTGYPGITCVTFAPEEVTREEVIRAAKLGQDAERLGVVVSAEEARRVRDLKEPR